VLIHGRPRSDVQRRTSGRRPREIDEVSPQRPRTKDWPTPMNSAALHRLQRLTPSHPAGPSLPAPSASQSDFSYSPAANSPSGGRNRWNIH
jgi:hypothetical protein